jgi:non-homologous end joining protein Ku
MHDEYAAAVRELVQAKLNNAPPEIELKSEKGRHNGRNIMAALKKSVAVKSSQKPRDLVQKEKAAARAKAAPPSRGTPRQPR